MIMDAMVLKNLTTERYYLPLMNLIRCPPGSR
jgi:hypothetical protein